MTKSDVQRVIQIKDKEEKKGNWKKMSNINYKDHEIYLKINK